LDRARRAARGLGPAAGRDSACSSIDSRRVRCTGVDVDDQGNATVAEQRLHQLIRQPGPITDRTFEINFLDPEVQAYAFTFG
jgi:hypothetical protein